MLYHVLVVDDDPDLAMLAQLLLQHAGFQVTVANNGEQALTRCEEECPDVVLLDMNLPKVSGFEVIRRMRADERFKDVKIIGLTANSVAPNSDEAQMADLMLMKPVENPVLVAMVRRIVESKSESTGLT